MNTSIAQLYEHYLQCTAVQTDSRKVKKDNLFVALKGPRFNGNQFAERALKQGAKFAVIDEVAYQKDERYLLVTNTLEALQELAIYHRKQLNIALIALTGSNGKTTTKELINAVLSTTYRTQATQGNFNNHIGVPLTILGIRKDTEMAVVEMGANHANEINQLCGIARPNFGLITNIGRAHLEGFGSIEGVQRAKGELFEYLEAAGGRAFINLNDQRVSELGYYLPKTSTYGSNRWAKTTGKIIDADPFLQISWLPKPASKNAPKPVSIPIQTQLIGRYNFDNVLAAIAVGTHFKIPPAKIQQAIANYLPTNNRSQVVKWQTNTLILDAYNANPSSMSAALANFADLPASPKIALLGDMLELGEYAASAHQEIIQLLKNMQLKKAILVGQTFASVQESLPNFHYFVDRQAMQKWWKQQHFEQTTFLVKASRGIALERIFVY